MPWPFNGKHRWAYLFVPFSLGALLTCLVLSLKAKLFTNSIAEDNYVISRVNSHEFVKPVIGVEPLRESPAFLQFKPDLQRLIDSLTHTGDIYHASVYLREFKHGEWMSLNDSARFHPASLMKVALLMSVLNIAESAPDLFTQKLIFKKPFGLDTLRQYYKFPTLENGKAYTVHELLYYLIAYSDNNAAWLLSSRLNAEQVKRPFIELGLPEPLNDDLQFTLTARQCATFFKAIYNASNMSPEYADYAAKLLSNCAFREGFVKGLPPGTKMWHKFGEWRHLGQDYELHEVGVVYLHDTPYLLAIMTSGVDTDRQAGAIRMISSAIGRKIAWP